MKKILFVMTSLYNGGAERSLVNLLTEMPKDRYEIDLLLFKKAGLFLAQVPQNVRVLDTPKSLRRMYGPLREAGRYLPWKLAGNAVSLSLTKSAPERRAFRWKHFYSRVIEKLDGHYDFAIAYISSEILYYVDEKVDAKRKFVWIHNDYRSAQHPREYDYPHLKNMSGIVSISDACVEILKEEFPAFSPKLFMLENITSSAVLKRRAGEFFPEEYQNGQITLLSIGRLARQKGFDLAIKAAALLKKEGLAFRWFIIGTGELKDELSKQIESEQISDRLVLLGARENPYPYIKNCTIFVQTSRFEGKSVVLDEAKILAKPIVVTAYPTVGDQIMGGDEGLITELSPESITSGIREILGNRALREHISGFLAAHEYGNQDEVKKYIQMIEGTS